MPAYGDLGTMSLAALFQWITAEEKTGRLRVQGSGTTSDVFCRDGFLVGCDSSAPTTLLGPLLVSRGRIDGATLRQAAGNRQIDCNRLGAALVKAGAITADELDAHLTAMTERTLYELFNQKEATFRFDDDVAPGASVFPVRLEVTGILLEGHRRRDETRHMQADLGGPLTVLRRSGSITTNAAGLTPAELRILGLIDGQNTLAEVLERCGTSAYEALKLLDEQFEAGRIEGPPDTSRGTDRGVPTTSIPVRVEMAEQDNELSPEEQLLLFMIDGRDIQSILWTSPLGEEEALDVLSGMIRRGLIELTDGTPCDTEWTNRR